MQVSSAVERNVQKKESWELLGYFEQMGNRSSLPF